MEDLHNIIKEMKGYKLEVDDDSILECATRIFISNNISKQKAFEPRDNSNEPTKSQVWYMNKNKITIPEGMTKGEASGVIKEHKSKQ